MNNPPPRLFKYEPPTLQTLLNLKNQILFFGSPRNFNDPYDCGLVPRAKPPTAEQMMLFKARFDADPTKPPDAKRELLGQSDSSVGDLIVRAGCSALHANTEAFLSTKGVTCFSETNESLLMWSHYALRGTGICLQFDTQFDPFGKVRQVTYSERIPELDVTAMLLEQNYDEIIKLYCTKSSHWSYEREWRGIHKEANTSFKYVPHCLQAIYFGTEADRSFIELTQIVVRSTNRSVRLFSGTRSDVAYKVEFTELDHN